MDAPSAITQVKPLIPRGFLMPVCKEFGRRDSSFRFESLPRNRNRDQFVSRKQVPLIPVAVFSRLRCWGCLVVWWYKVPVGNPRASKECDHCFLFRVVSRNVELLRFLLRVCTRLGRFHAWQREPSAHRRCFHPQCRICSRRLCRWVWPTVQTRSSSRCLYWKVFLSQWFFDFARKDM